MKFPLFVIIFLCLLSCKSEAEDSQNSNDSKDSVSYDKKIEIDTRGFDLEPEAKKYASNWLEFITAQNEVKKLENTTTRKVMNNATAISQIMNSLSISLPDSLRAVPVEARLNVLKTKAHLLEQYSKKQQPDVKDIDRTAREIYLEFNNLKLQMNELFLKTLEDFEKELDEFERMEREMDSTATEDTVENIVS